MELLRNIAAVLGLLASIVVAVSAILGKLARPMRWLARPAIRALQAELREQIELVWVSDPMAQQITEQIEETVAYEVRQIVTAVDELTGRVGSLERAVRSRG